MRLIVLLCLSMHVSSGRVKYTIPEPTIELLMPRGFQIAIPNDDNIVLVGFHVNIDKPISFNDPGELDGDTTRSINGQWIFRDTKTFVDPGNTIFYWIHVQYKNLVFRKNGNLTVGYSAPGTSQTPETTETPTKGVTEPSRSSPRRCNKSVTTVGRNPACGGELIFEDHFDTLNSTVWKHENFIPTDLGDADFVSFQSRPENCFVNSGHLFIVPNLLFEVPGFNELSIKRGVLDLGSECTAIFNIEEGCKRQAKFSQILPPIVSARIRTKENFSFRYGKVEVRAKLPKGDWLFPLIALEPTENFYGITGYESGQMRVAFSRGNELLEDREGNDISGHRLYGGVVLSTGPGLRNIGLKNSLHNDTLGNDFHTYTLTWTDSFISVAIDNHEYGVISGGFSQLRKSNNISHAALWENGGFMAPFDREFFLTLGVSAGGNGDFPNDCLTSLSRNIKPWRNQHPKAELQFWNDHQAWTETWNGTDSGLKIDYIKVYAL